MDFDEYWQENKRFVGYVAAALIVFMIARSVIDSTVGGEVRSERLALKSAQDKLKTAMYDGQARVKAKIDNRELTEVVDQLSQAVGFVPRPAFELTDSRSASSRYHSTLANTRDELLPLAGRHNMALDADLGQPELSPTRAEDIERYLEGLDLVDRMVRLAVDAGVTSMEGVQVTLDNSLRSREGVGALERTRVKAKLAGSGRALLEFLRLTQRAERVAGGQTLIVESADLRTAKRASGAELEVIFNVVRFAPIEDVLDQEVQ